MPSFIYKAVDALGDEMPGTVQAGDISSAIASLQSQALTVLSIREVEGSLNIAAQLRRLATLRTPTTTHKASFFRQVAMLLKGGHTLTEALALCAATSDRKPLHDGIVHMLVRIHNGETSFAGAVRDLDRLFPPFVASLLATGERSGELVTALERVADHLEQDARIRLQLFNSLVYPTVIVAIALAIFAGLTIFVVPKFADALQKAGHVEIPFGAQLMLDLSQWIDRFGIHALTVTAVVLVVVFAGYRLGLIKNFVDRLVFKIPFVGTNILNASMAHMGWTMSVLLQSGQSLLESLEFLARNTGNRVISDSFRKARDEILEGNNLAHSLDQPEIPLLVRNMCVVGERSGQLESAVRGLGEHFQRESSRRLKTTIAVMEPVMTLSVAGLVAFIYISFFKALMLVNTAI